MKTMYRATLRLLGDRFVKVPPSNMFLRALDLEHADRFARQVYEEAMITNGIPRSTPYTCQIIRSSDEEVEEYRKGMQANKVSRMVN